MSAPGTQLLINAGYAGFKHIDYDPRDFQRDLPSVLIFNPTKSVTKFDLIRV